MSVAYDRLKLTTMKEGKVLATAIALQGIPDETMFHEEVISLARELIESRNDTSEEQFKRMLFRYSATLASLTATFVTTVCLTESQLEEMMNEIEEFDEIEKGMKQ